MDTVLTEPVEITDAIKELVDKETSDWGVDVESVNIHKWNCPPR
jgi:regulator of protease activity HflC (stomatin/prohibitin superfamily)